jgi:hypothetical protein
MMSLYYAPTIGTVSQLWRASKTLQQKDLKPFCERQTNKNVGMGDFSVSLTVNLGF